MKTELTAIVVENEAETAEYIAAELLEHPRIANVIVFYSAEEFLHSEEKKDGEIIFLDIHLKDMNGIDLAGIISEQNPEQKIIMLTSLASDDAIFNSVRNGAIGYIVKSDLLQLHSYLDVFLDGGAIMSAPVALRVMQEFHKARKRDPAGKELTAREKQALQLLSQGYPTREAAAQMSITAETLRGYIKSMYKKLQVASRIELIRKAEKNGLV